MTIVGLQRVLISAAAFRAGMLAKLRDLIARVVGSDGRRVDTAALPIQDLRFDSAAQNVGIDLLLPALRDTAIERAFIRERNDLATGTTTATVGSSFRGEVRI